MFYLFFILFTWLGSALGAAVPASALVARQDPGVPQIIQPPPSPLSPTPPLAPPPPPLFPTPPLPPPPPDTTTGVILSTRLGEPTREMVTTETSTFTSTVPSSTTTRTFTSTSPPSIVATVVSATTVIQTVETTLELNSAAQETSLAVATNAPDTTGNTNAAVGLMMRNGGESGIRLGWTIAFGLLLIKAV